VAEDYRQRGRAFGVAEAAVARQADRISQVRLGAFIIGAGSILSLMAGWRPTPLFVVGAVVGIAGYLLAARRHRRLSRRVRWSGVRRVVCDQGVLRIARDWNALTPPPPRTAIPDHPFAGDLDITGHASLERLLDVTSPGPGKRTLMSWLLDGAPTRAELANRQAGVRELAPAVEWRETLTAHARTAGASRRTADVDRFLSWAEQGTWLIDRPAMLWASRALPFLIIPTAALALLSLLWSNGTVPPPGSWAVSLAAVARQIWLIPLAAGVLLTVRARSATTERLQAAMSHLGSLSAYAAMLGHVESAQFASPRLNDLKQRLSTGKGAASELQRLGAVVRLAEARYSPMGHVVLQVFGLWDFHVLAALERWQTRSGAHARDWLAALGEAEALSALATLAYDNPSWVTPELLDGPARLEAAALGHPLIAETTRVANDVTLGPPGTFMLVTGSNMSGKSTLLRAIGMNVVLAQAGGPVCAKSMSLTPVDIWTSIRIDDSLEAGVSLFMAELRRLKRIVDAARDPGRPRPLLYLLDEILHGTNTAERRIAARRVLTYLLEAGAIGAVTSHDLTLAEDPSLETAAQRVHFTERFERTDTGMSMSFDYTLRPGLATSANALKLLAMIGLGDE
jgi:ABC-type multidrug transport system fused ATPase/permease subunit